MRQHIRVLSLSVPLILVACGVEEEVQIDGSTKEVPGAGGKTVSPRRP